jgi:hypothetical protein
MQPSAKTPLAVAMVKRADLDTLMCVHSKTSLCTKSLEVSGSKNTVCFPATIQIYKITTQTGSVLVLAVSTGEFTSSLL